VIRVFPIALPTVATVCGYFGDTRGNGTRSHQGVDLCAPIGTPLLAVDDGFVKQGTDPLGGTVVTLDAPDGTHYYYAHLSAYGASGNVSADDVIGYVGKTGDAAPAGIPSHLHFEMHPQGGPTVDPLPALQAAPRRTVPQRRSAALVAAAAILAVGGIAVWAVWR
jgi:murein DD-endopeptidase MepM/ murein hydrolase activator NlpD